MSSAAAVTIRFDGLDIRLLGPGPFVARSASDKTDDWPFWMVCQADRSRPNGLLNLLRFPTGQMFTSRDAAEAIAAKANAAGEAQ
jgi:hypothetical protein